MSRCLGCAYVCRESVAVHTFRNHMFVACAGVLAPSLFSAFSDSCSEQLAILAGVFVPSTFVRLRFRAQRGTVRWGDMWRFVVGLCTPLLVV